MIVMNFCSDDDYEFDYLMIRMISDELRRFLMMILTSDDEEF